MKQRKQSIQTEEKIYNFIQEYFKKWNIPPTVREIADGIGISSTNTINIRLDNMAARGVITRYKNVSRGVVLNES